MASTTAGTSAPAVTREEAAASSSGPLPATTIRRPGSTRPALSMACAPPAVTTPGRVQPGKGSCRSYAPVASRTAAARTVVRSSASGPVVACSRQSPSPARSSAQT